jgi:PAS domain S-box-containing protein
VQGVTDYAIYLLSLEGMVASWNAGAERIKGYKPEEAIGQHFSIFYTEEDSANGLPAIALETARREGRFEKEGLRVRKDGTKFWANVVIDAIRDGEGVLIGFAKITRDISERKRAEETIERTREALVQSQKMEAIGHLTGGVAHDFNNLLMAIQGSLEMMKRRLPSSDSQMHRFIDNALQGAQRGAALTQRMLAFARRQELKLQSVNVIETHQRHGRFVAEFIGFSHPDRNPLLAGPAKGVGRCKPA